jgi:hypothetical protein
VDSLLRAGTAARVVTARHDRHPSRVRAAGDRPPSRAHGHRAIGPHRRHHTTPRPDTRHRRRPQRLKGSACARAHAAWSTHGSAAWHGRSATTQSPTSVARPPPRSPAAHRPSSARPRSGRRRSDPDWIGPDEPAPADREPEVRTRPSCPTRRPEPTPSPAPTSQQRQRPHRQLSPTRDLQWHI